MRGTGILAKYGIYYDGFMWRLFKFHVYYKLFLSLINIKIDSS